MTVTPDKLNEVKDVLKKIRIKLGIEKEEDNDENWVLVLVIIKKNIYSNLIILFLDD